MSKFNRNEATASDLPRLEKMLTCHAIISLWFGPTVVKSNEECIGFVSEEFETTAETEIMPAKEVGKMKTKLHTQTVTLSIDNQEVTVPKGTTILEAAKG